MSSSMHLSPHQRAGGSGLTPTVFIVDDDLSVRESLELLVGTLGCQVTSFASAEEFLARPRAMSPSCLVLDISLPQLDGLDLQAILADRKETPIIFVTGHRDIQMTVRAMKAGAVEFLTKPFSSPAILDAIKQALDRSHRALAEEAHMRNLLDRYASLSHRERQVLKLVASGLLNKQVGGELGISEITVKAHRGKVMRKMAAHSLADLVNMAGTLRLGVETHRSARSGRDLEGHAREKSAPDVGAEIRP